MPIPPLAKQLSRRTRGLFLTFLGAVLIPAFVDFPAKYEARIDRAFEVVAIISLFLQIGIWANVLVTHWARTYAERHDSGPGDTTTIQAISVLVKVTLWVLLGILMLEEGFHQNVTTLLAGLGVGGIAIAFALQNVLADLFAAMSIVTDKPFVIGDSITVDDLSGKVEYIGLKSTRVRSDNGEQIVFGNSDLLKGRIRNFGRMSQRLATITTSVAGNTPPERLERVPVIIRAIIEAVPNARFVRSSLTAVGTATIDFTSLYYLTDPTYQIYVDAQQTVMLEIMRQLKADGTVLGAEVESAVKQSVAGLSAPASSS